MITFADPLYLLWLLLLVPMVWRYFFFRRRPALPFSNLAMVKLAKGQAGATRWLRDLLFALRVAAVIFLVLALARPQWGASELKRNSEGLDIVLAIDTSGSMRALDFEVEGDTTNRLVAVKHVIEKFISERPEDRIGMVVFGGEAFTQAPLTLDHNIILEFLKAIKIGVAGDATAIGDAIATSTNRLRDVQAKSKVVILLTDGENTAGSIEPLTAAKAAAAVGVKVYTIAVGKDGEVPFPMDTPFGRRLTYQKMRVDEKSLQAIAEATGAQFFRAYDTDSLKNVYATIDKLEKTKIEIKEFKNYQDAFSLFLWPGLLSLALELVLGWLGLRRLP